MGDREGCHFYLFIYLCLCWVFVSVWGLSLVAASGGHSSSRCAGLSLSRPLLLWSTGSRCAGSVIVAHGPSCSAACGIFPDQGSNPCALHRKADFQPLRHQGSPAIFKRMTKDSCFDVPDRPYTWRWEPDQELGRKHSWWRPGLALAYVLGKSRSQCSWSQVGEWEGTGQGHRKWESRWNKKL